MDFSFLFLFLRSCSCLRLFTWGVFGSEWQENVTGTVQDCVASQGYSTSLATLSVTARCRIHFTLERSLFTWGVCMNKEQFNRRIPPLCFHFPNMQKDGMKGNGERENCVKEVTAKQRNVWYRLGLWRWSTEPNVCVCDKTGVNLSSEAESKDFFFFPGKTLCFTVVFLLEHYKHPFSPSSKLWPHPFIGSSFLEDRPFDFYSFEKEHAWVHSRNGREGLFVDLPSVKSQVGA